MREPAVIPRTLQEFRIGLGRAVIAQRAAAQGNPAPAELSLQSYLDAARSWRTEHAHNVQSVVLMARNAAAGENPQATITTWLNDDICGVGTFLRNVQPQHFRSAVFTGMHMSRPIGQVRQHLQLLVQLNDL